MNINCKGFGFVGDFSRVFLHGVVLCLHREAFCVD